MTRPNKIGRKFGGKEKSKVNKFESESAILAELRATRQELLKNGGSQQIGDILFTLNHKHDDLSVAFKNTNLVYPFLSLDDREKSDAFLPRTFQTHFTSRPLYDAIKDYTHTKGLSPEDTERLYKYLEPLFYIVQMEISPFLEGGKTKSLYESPRWVYQKTYEQMLNSVRDQVEHHFVMLQHTPITGLHKDQVRGGLAGHLLDLGLSLLPDANRTLHQDRGTVYVLGRNLNGHVSLLHPHADYLPYPVLKEQRLVPRANIPHNFERIPASYKQWRRADEFVDLSDYRFNEEEKGRMKRLMEGIGTLFHKHLSTFHVQKFPVGDEYTELTEAMARSFVENSTIPEPYLTEFYHQDIDPDIHHVLSNIKNKGTTHRSLTSDLWPARLNDDDVQKNITYEAIKYLMFKDILDRSAEYNVYRNVARMGQVMRR